MSVQSWQPLVADGSVLGLKYKFSFGTANCMAVRLDDGSWLVVSPSMNPSAEVLEELGKQGPVSALLAPNAYHHMGQGAWRARFPEAKSYAPAGALPRLAKKSPGIAFENVEALAARLPARVAVLSPNGMKQPDVMVRATSGKDTAWFTGDLVSNTTETDVGMLTRMIFKLLGGGLGYRFNPVPSMVYLRDRDAWFGSVRSAIGAAPPTVVLPAHGDVVRDDVAQQTQRILA